MTFRITMNDIRAAGYCGTGLRDFCRIHNLDLTKLVNEGWTEEDVSHVEDEHLLRVIDVAKKREQPDG
jgi:hypothetical protein